MACGVIDCHVENGNPLLSRLDDIGCKYIEFLIISHPHFDHFSGVLDLFSYCETKGIQINNLGLTFEGTVGVVYQKYYSYSKQKLLKDFFDRIFDQIDKPVNRFVKKIFLVNKDTASLKIEDFQVHFRAPHPEDLLKINRSLSKWANEEIVQEPNLNTFGSIVEVQCGDRFALLTSDAILKNFKALNAFYSRTYSDNKFHLVQIAHHGSNANYFDKFWADLNVISNCPAVFSVGDEPKDKLPHVDVVKSIAMLGYSVFSTNYVYGIKDYFPLSSTGSATVPDTPVILEMVAGTRKTYYHSIPKQFVGNQLFSL